jgi:hypothetical protein
MMTDVKTDLGRSRAFIRLALERKLLSFHLRYLLSNQELLVSLYKRYAFLRCEEEREQFITHLLTLNAVDLNSFTNTFSTSILRYKLFTEGSRPFAGWISLSGSLTTSSELHFQNPSRAFTFKHRNLGSLKTLTVFVGQPKKLYLDKLFLRNEYTGQTYLFSCQRWLGRNVKDGAMERVLLAQPLQSHMSILG